MAKRIVLTCLCVTWLWVPIAAQTTAFTYQGRLTEGGLSTTGQHDFVFRLFTLVSGGSQVSKDVVRDDVEVSNGIFNVTLDFGSSPFFDGTGNFLEILVRPGASSGSYATLSPRQPVVSSPYAVQTIRAAVAATAENALQLGGVNANQFVQTNDIRLVDPRPPLAGSNDYVRNSLDPQVAHFNITGLGTLTHLNAGSVTTGIVTTPEINVTGLFKINGGRFLHSVGSTVVVGSTITNPSSDRNTLVGFSPGANTSTGARNTYVGTEAGSFNNGNRNTFIGSSAGRFIAGDFNSMVGEEAGFQASSGNGNSFFGYSSGGDNDTGSHNTFIGYDAGTNRPDLVNAAAIGAFGFVEASNSLVLGSIAGRNGATASTNVGIGTTEPRTRLHVAGGSVYIANPNSLVITSPNGACWFITVSDMGVLSSFNIPCP